MANRLIKFKDMHTKEPTYIDINKIFSIYKCVGINTGTTILSSSGFSVNVEEHIAEVIALIENRDSLPAKVLFGAKGSE